MPAQAGIQRTDRHSGESRNPCLRSIGASYLDAGFRRHDDQRSFE
jgi:hypothetical protein